MAGKQCMGNTDVPNDVALSRAYCEGRNAAYAGDLITTNPHPSGTPAADAWDRGWNSYNAGVGTALPQDCCDKPAFDGVP